MPEGWRTSKWGDEVSLQYGKAIRGYQNTTGPYRVFGSNGPVGWHAEALASGPGVILGRKGAYRGVRFSRDPFFVIDTAYYVQPQGNMDMRWLYYAVIHHRLGEIDDGSPIPSTTRAAVYVRDIDVPPLDEQKAIAEVLGTLDDKIELNRGMNETLEAMAQAIFRDWFVDFGPTLRKIDGAIDPVEIMGGLVTDADRAQQLADLFPAKLGDNRLPEGWTSQPLLDQAFWVNGAAYKNMHFSEEADALPVVKIAELKNGITASTKRTNSRLGERYRISDGELLFSWSGNPDTSIDTFVWTGGQAWLNQHIFAVRSNGVRSRSSLYVLLRWLKPEFAEIARNKQTTGLGHVTKEDMKRLLVRSAPNDVEVAFEKLIDPLIELLISRLFESRTVAATRDLLLPKLMSGEIRLCQAERLMEAAAE